MTFALAHAATVQPFNETYYATVAAVIPVLFIAITVPGGAYGKLGRAYRSIPARVRDKDLAELTRRGLLTVAILVVLAGVLGEGVALHALESRSAVRGTATEELFYAMTLALAAAAGPLAWLWSGFETGPSEAARDSDAAGLTDENLTICRSGRRAAGRWRPELPALRRPRRASVLPLPPTATS